MIAVLVEHGSPDYRQTSLVRIVPELDDHLLEALNLARDGIDSLGYELQAEGAAIYLMRIKPGETVRYRNQDIMYIRRNLRLPGMKEGWIEEWRDQNTKRRAEKAVDESRPSSIK